MIDYKEKCKEYVNQINILTNKIKNLEKGYPPIRKNLLGLVPGKLYLILTDGRRIVAKLEFESAGFICYSKRAGEKYYANKLNIQLIKEMSESDQKSYYKSNFQEYEKL